MARAFRLAIEQHLRGEIIDERGENHAQHAKIENAREQRASEGARNDAGRQGPQHDPVHRAETMVADGAGGGGENRRRHPRPQCKVDDEFGREAFGRENEREHGHDRRAATDAEESAEEADEGAERERGPPPVEHQHSLSFAALTAMRRRAR